VAGGKNAVINGGFDIWQRGTSGTITGGNIYASADRWISRTANAGGSLTVSQQSPGSTLPQFQYCARVQRVAGNTDTGTFHIINTFETKESVRFAGQTVTLSFWARAGANYSSSGLSMSPQVYSGTGTDQPWYSFTGANAVTTPTITLTSSWQKFTASGSVPSNSTQLYVAFVYGPTGTAGTNDYFEVAGVQLEQGSVATAFSRAGGTLQGELAACQRYYQKINQSGNQNNILQGWANGTTICDAYWRLMPMRVAPTSLDVSGYGIYRPANTTTYTGGTITLYAYCDSVAQVRYTHGSGVFTPAENLIVNINAGYVGFNAEL
jgi:hypothetical protein